MHGLVVDLFAGGGGASAGIEAALGRPVDIAINHDRAALAVHKANHPATIHLEADIWEVRPREATGGRHVALLWASPDCTHFSVAKGAKPRRQNIRSLAWVVVRWAKEVRPDVILLENVQEFRGWGPLDAAGKPDRARMGHTFRRWRGRLEGLGYVVDHRVLDASHYGAPTRRKRLFLVARCDGQSIRWPEPTHGPGRVPVHTAAECIDWSIPCPSIFERKRPLADKTLWRIAEGLRRFVFEHPRPYIVRMAHGQVALDGSQRRGHGAHDAGAPLPTITGSGGGGGFAVAVPTLVGVGGRAGQSHPTAADAPVGTVTAKGDRALLVPALLKMRGDAHSSGPEEPVPTITAGGDQGGHTLGIVVPALVEMNHANAPHGVDEPLGVVTTQGNRFVLTAPALVQVGHGGASARTEDAQRPLTTVTATQRGHALVAPLLAPTLIQTGYGEREGQRPRALDLQKPLGTIIADGSGGNGKHAAVAAFLAKHFGDNGQRPGLGMDEPVATVTATDHHALTAATLVKLRGECTGTAADEPVPTVSAQGNHVAEVRAFLTAYYQSDGTSGQHVLEALRTLTTKARLGLVTIEGTDYQVVDVGMRMLEPHELLRAQFGRFADSYDLSAARTKAGKVRLIGNSVCPEVAEALVAANVDAEGQESVA